MFEPYLFDSDLDPQAEELDRLYLILDTQENAPESVREETLTAIEALTDQIDQALTEVKAQAPDGVLSDLTWMLMEDNGYPQVWYGREVSK